MSIDKVLIVDDDPLMRNFLAETLTRKNIEVSIAESGKEALKIMKEKTFDLIITDMRMDEITGIDVLCKSKNLYPSTLIVVITGFGTVESAVEAMRLGAFNYIIKPFSADTIETVIEKASQHLSLMSENQFLKQELKSDNGSAKHVVIGKSPQILNILANIPQIARSNANVFIHGESGTGKEVIAHAIHYNSLRANNPFIKVNCAAIPDTLVESEFFGHEKGAFTGAIAKKLGRFEIAHNGTLLLDEVTEIPILLQAKLLRAIQEKKFERVGGTKEVAVDIRIVSTSNRNMEEAIAQKVLREDLYYRLNVVPIYLPPLRERKEDIVPLARHFLEKACRENHQEVKILSVEAEQKLLSYSWPGNARELANVIERAVVMNIGNIIKGDQLYLPELNSSQSKAKTPLPSGTTLKELEKRLILETLLSQQNDKTKTAELLGISPRTLHTKLQQYTAD